MPAPRVSQKLSGAPKGKPRAKVNRPGEIDPTMLGSITLNRDAIQALTIAQAKVQVTISAGGTTAILVSEETGRQIGGLEDLAKLLGLRSFVTKEKKASASSELQEEILTAAFRASAKASADDSSFKQKKLDNSFVLAAKPYKNLVDVMNDRAQTLEGNYHEDSAEYKDVLRAYCSRIIDAAGDVLTEMVKGKKEKGLMDSFLLDKGVPSYVKNKLQLKSLAITKDMDLSRVLFPQDPSKGLSFTIAEWRSSAFVKKQGWLMRNSEPLIRIIQDDKLFLELIGMSRAEFHNAEDPKVQRVLKTRIHVVPPFEDHNRVLEPLSRSNFRGFGLPSTAMDQSRDRLHNLCAVFLRAYAFSVRMAETLSDFYDRIVSEGTIMTPDEKLGNYAKQMLDAIDNGEEVSLLSKLRLQEPTTALMAWIDRECKIIPNGDLHKQIDAVLTQGGAGKEDYSPSFMGNIVKPVAPKVDMVSPISTGTEKDRFKSFRSDALALKDKGGKGRKNNIASSVLSKNAKSFLKHVAKDHSPMLAQSMEGYFRGFYSEAIQAAAVRIAEARFDDLEELSELSNASDESSDGEDSDDES